MKKTPKIRLYANSPLSIGMEWVPDTGQIHYLLNVLRMESGDELKLFDNQSGEYIGVISQISKKSCVIHILDKTREMERSPDLWLLFAPIKKDKTDFIISGATELGVRKIIPVITKRTISERVKKERFEAQVIEASEQSRRLDVPEITEAYTLEKILKEWPQNRILYFMDESGQGGVIADIFGKADKQQSAAVLVGPEGGFSDEELKTLRGLSFAYGVSMGKRILRAETAVQAALSCWQALCGDWQKNH